MIEDTENPMAPARESPFGEVRKHWQWMLALGIAGVLLGTLGLAMAFALTIASVIVFGALLAVGGGIQLVDAFKCKGWKSTLWHVLIALLYLAAGIIVFADPLMATYLLTAMLAGAIVAVGILRIVMAFDMRGHRGWIWTLVSGLASLVLGGLIFYQWPVSALWVIGLLIALELIINGWAYIVIALAARREAREDEAASPT